MTEHFGSVKEKKKKINVPTCGNYSEYKSWWIYA